MRLVRTLIFHWFIFIFSFFTEGVYLSKRVFFFFDLKKPEPNKDIGKHVWKNKKQTEFDHSPITYFYPKFFAVFVKFICLT